MPLLTTLSHSAGEQSHALLEMVKRGDIPRPKSFAVFNANPGMEDERSSGFVDIARRGCEEMGIEYITANGPNLYHDLTTFKERGLTRIDNPPYYTRNRITGKKGKLKQGCTQFYKIQPMRRALRWYLHHHLGVSTTAKRGLPKVETWIGFAADEAHRCKPSDVKFITLRYPLIEMGMTKAMVAGYYLKHGIPRPPRSVCCACFANGLAYYEDMYHNRPDDWDKAVKVDDAVRDMRRVGIKDEVFVSETLIPLRDLPAKNFMQSDDKFYREHRCNSGVCFV